MTNRQTYEQVNTGTTIDRNTDIQKLRLAHIGTNWN